MRIEKLTTHIGAELVGVDLAEAATNDDLFGTIREALLAHKVLFARDQIITKSDHVAFSARFGELEAHPMLGSDPDHPGLVCIYKDLDSPPEHFENAWHCDATWREKPPMGAVLRCLECPPVGGDTVWSNMVRAYDDLSDEIQERIEGLYARHSIEASFGARLPIERRHALKAQFPDPSTQWSAPIPKPVSGSFSSTAMRRISRISTRPITCVTGKTTPRAGQTC